MNARQFLITAGMASALLLITSCNSNPGPDAISSHGASQAGAITSNCGLCHVFALGSRRAIVGANGDFGSNAGIASHHVVGLNDPTDAQCLVCHNIDQHGSGTVRLNNADTGAVIPYTSAATMETFCLSCHDTDGANTNMSPFADGVVLGQLYTPPTVLGYPTSNQPVTTGWTDPNNAHADDGAYATASPAQNATIDSRWSGFGFDTLLPAPPYTARIDAVKIIAEYRVSTAASLAYLDARAISGGTTCPVQTNSTEPLSDTVVTFDFTNCLTTWTRDDLLNANFQVQIGARRGNSATAVNFFLDNVRVEVTYNRTGYKASSEIETHWNRTLGHRRQGLTCVGNGDPNTGCHQNAHGSQYVGLLAKNLTLPAIFPPYVTAHESNYELCFSCHANYPGVTKEAILGVRAGSLYDNDHGKGGTNRPPYYIPEISTLFQDLNAQGTGQPYDNPTMFSPAYVNLHYYHLQAGIWAYRDVVSSGINCLSCHSVHGSDTQWGWLHDSMLFSHVPGVAPDEYGIMNVPMASLSNFPTSCGGFNCHQFFGTTHSWFTPLAEMVTRFPGTNETVTTGWTAADNAHAQDAIYATASPAENSTIDSRWGNFGFDSLIPSSIVRINRVRIIARYKVDTNASVATLYAQATVGGIDCPPVPLTNAAEPLADTDAFFNVTSCRAWTRDDLLNANFKVRIGANRGVGPNPVTFSLDSVKVEVRYHY